MDRRPIRGATARAGRRPRTAAALLVMAAALLASAGPEARAHPDAVPYRMKQALHGCWTRLIRPTSKRACLGRRTLCFQNGRAMSVSHLGMDCHGDTACYRWHRAGRRLVARDAYGEGDRCLYDLDPARRALTLGDCRGAGEYLRDDDEPRWTMPCRGRPAEEEDE